MAVNGVSECFAFAVMSTSGSAIDLSKLSRGRVQSPRLKNRACSGLDSPLQAKGIGYIALDKVCK